MLPSRAPLIAAVLFAIVVAGSSSAQPVDRGAQLRELQAEIVDLERDLKRLGSREAGLLGELERLAADLRLRQAEYDEVTLRVEALGAEIEASDRTIEDLDEAQQLRRTYLAFRLREVYKAGPDQALSRLVGGAEVDIYLRGLSYASFLSERDGEVLEAFRTDSERSRREQDKRLVARDELLQAQAEVGEARDRLESSRKRRMRSLRNVRRDQTQRRVALGELQEAATQLSEVVESLAQEGATLDVRKFKGLLEWPCEGKVSAGFGTVVHPQFRTQVPHPGWDIDAEYGDPIRSVFDGHVVYSNWMRGYGLTLIVDHGENVMSIYAHGSALVAEQGEKVEAGQVLGMVGDTGSLRGTYLYFELRVDGEPQDPSLWLRSR